MKKLIVVLSTTLLILNVSAQSSITDFTPHYYIKQCGLVYVEFYYVNGNVYSADSLIWDYGDGTIRRNSHTNSSLAHTYSTVGSYTVSLTLWKDGIETKIEKPDLIVLHNSPDPYFSYSVSDSLLVAPVDIELSGFITPGDDDSITFYWEVLGPHSFDPSSKINVTYTLDVPGQYLIRLTAYDENNCEKTYSEGIYVIDSLQLNQFEFTDSVCTEDKTVKNYLIENDTLKIWGTISRNCCGTNTAVINWQNDTLFIPTCVRGDSCDCNCIYNFRINVPDVYEDSVIVVFDNDIVIATNKAYCMKWGNPLHVTTCNSYESPSGKHTWTSSGLYTDTLKTGYGCDSLISIVLTIHSDINTEFDTVICEGDRVYFEGEYYSEPGTYSKSYTLTTGCDSIIKMNLSTKICTAIFYNHIEREMKVYPLPASENIKVIVPENINNLYNILIYDMLGNVIYNKECRFNEGAKNINISSMPAGIYYLQIKTVEGHTFFKKIMIY